MAKQTQANRWRGGIAVVLAGIGYGFLGVFGKRAFAAGFSPEQALTFRYLIAAGALGLGLTLTRRELLRIPLGQLLLCAGLGAFGFAGFSSLYFAALHSLSASLTSLLLYTFPVIVTVMARVCFGEAVTARQWLALPVVAAGLVALLWGDLRVENARAIAYGLGSAWLYAAYILGSSRWLTPVPALSAALYVMASAGVALLLVHGGSLMTGPVASAFGPEGLELSRWLPILGLALVSTVGPIALFLTGLKHLKASEASVLSAVEPLTAALCAVAFLGETLLPMQWAGGGIVLFGMLLTYWDRG